MARFAIYVLTFFLALAMDGGVFGQSIDANFSRRIDDKLRLADSLRRAREFGLAWTTISGLTAALPGLSPMQRAEYYKIEGDCHFGKDRFPEALIALRTARALFATDTSRQARSKVVNLYTSVANVLTMQGRFRAARDTAQLAFRLASDTTGIGTGPQQHALRAIALAAERLGDYDASLTASCTALGILAESEGENSAAAGYVHNQLGVTYQRLGRFVEARASYTRAVEIFTKHSGADSKLALAALTNVATTNELLGREEEAIPLLMRKLQIYRRDPTSDRLATVITLEQIASAQRNLGDLEAAFRSYGEALALLREIDAIPTLREVSLLTKTANLQLGMSDATLAAPNIQRALHLLGSLPDAPALERAKLFEVKGVYEESTGQARSASASFAEAYRILRGGDAIFHRDAIEIFPRFIHRQIADGTPLVALDTIQALTIALDEATPTLSPELCRSLKAMLLTLRADAYLALDRLPRDWKALADSLAAQSVGLYRLVAGLPSSRQQRQLGSHIAAVGPVYGALASLSLRALLDQASVSAAERSASLTQLDLYQEHLSKLARPISLRGIRAEDRPQVRVLGERLAGYEQLLAEESGTGLASQQARAILLDSAAALRRQLTRFPLDKSRTDAAADIRAGQEELDEDRLLLTFHVVGRDLVALACTRDTFRLRRVGPAADIEANAQAYTRFCRSPGESFEASVAILAQGAALYRELVGWLGERQLARTPRITVVGTRQVNGLPFAALPRESPGGSRGFRDVDFAVSTLHFSYARSVSDALRHAVDPRPKLAVAVVAPEVGASPQRDDLPAVYAEVDSLRAQTDVRVISGAQATFEGLLGALSGATALHLATHASSNIADGDYSYIVLRDSTGERTRRIYAQALAELPLEVNLVVLSACETGSGRSSLGQGVLSLANVFRDAGVQTVINTLWRVDDRQTVGIIARFYAGIDEEELPIDLALAAAQRHHLSSAGSQLLHPYFWAAYSVTGDLRPFGKTRSLPSGFWIPLGALGLAIVGVGVTRYKRGATFGRHAA